MVVKSDGAMELVEDLVSFVEVVVGIGIMMLIAGLVLELEVTVVTTVDDTEEDEISMVTATDDVTEEDNDGVSVTVGEENGVADETEDIMISIETL